MSRFTDLARRARHSAAMIVAVGKSIVESRARSADGSPPPPLPKAEERDYTRAELATFDGSDPTKPILFAVRGKVYDVTRGKTFYGPGGPYAQFAGKGCTRAFALDSLEAADLTDDETGLTSAQLSRLEEWIENFDQKYGAIGKLLD